MAVELFWIVGYVAVGAAFVALLVVLDSLLLGLANRFVARPRQCRLRTGTRLPRVCNRGPATD